MREGIEIPKLGSEPWRSLLASLDMIAVIQKALGGDWVARDFDAKIDSIEEELKLIQDSLTSKQLPEVLRPVVCLAALTRAFARRQASAWSNNLEVATQLEQINSEFEILHRQRLRLVKLFGVEWQSNRYPWLLLSGFEVERHSLRASELSSVIMFIFQDIRIEIEQLFKNAEEMERRCRSFCANVTPESLDKDIRDAADLLPGSMPNADKIEKANRLPGSATNAGEIILPPYVWLEILCVKKLLGLEAERATWLKEMGRVIRPDNHSLGILEKPGELSVAFHRRDRLYMFKRVQYGSWRIGLVAFVFAVLVVGAVVIQRGVLVGLL
jgi:hypothetical protein